MSDKTEYDTILSLARKSNYKKIMIIRDSWNTGNWCIVNSIKIKPDGEHCIPYGYIKYSNGNTFNGYLPVSNTYSWKLIKVLAEDINVVELKE